MKRLLMLMGILVAAACGGDGKPGTGNGDLTVGDVCDQIGQVFCDKLSDCDAPVDDCEDKFKNGCCTGTACDATAAATQRQVDDCADDIRAASCSTDDIPASCEQL